MRAAALAVGAFVAIAACGGGGGGGGTPTTPMPRLTFVATGGGGPDSLALATGGGSTASSLRLDLVATSVDDLYGVSFDLVFPAQVLRFDAATEGTLLSASGTVPTSFQVLESEPGRLIVGLSRLGDVGGTPGTGTLLTFQFAPLAAGSGGITFEAARAFDAAGSEIASARYVGGTVTYTP